MSVVLVHQFIASLAVNRRVGDNDDQACTIVDKFLEQLPGQPDAEIEKSPPSSCSVRIKPPCSRFKDSALLISFSGAQAY